MSSELQTVLRIGAELRAAGQPAFLATVVRTRGSTYRRPGARLLLDARGWRAGTVSGGCLEADLLESAWTRVNENGGRPLLIEYDTQRDGDILWGSGTGCGGAVEVLLERLPPGDGDAGATDPLLFLAESQRRREAAAVVTVIRSSTATAPPVGTHWYFAGQAESFSKMGECPAEFASALHAGVQGALALGRSRWETLPGASGEPGADVEVFIEIIPPPPALVVFGTGHDVVPIVRLTKALGWHVTVAGRRGTSGAARVLESLADAFVPHSAAVVGPETLALVMTHNYLADFGLLETLLPQQPRYLGLLGPAARRDRLLRDLAEAGKPGFVPAHRAWLHAPAGLDIGAETPEEIALAIVAEMQAVLAGRNGGTLRESRRPIHPAAEPDQGQIAARERAAS